MVMPSSQSATNHSAIDAKMVPTWRALGVILAGMEASRESCWCYYWRLGDSCVFFAPKRVYERHLGRFLNDIKANWHNLFPKVEPNRFNNLPKQQPNA